MSTHHVSRVVGGHPFSNPRTPLLPSEVVKILTASEVLVDQLTERPPGACVVCRPPTEGKDWKRADDRYRTCSTCYDRIRDTLQEIVKRYLMLNPRPGANSDGGRGAPGFGARSPASDHVISMRDRRSKSCEVAKDGVGYRQNRETGEYYAKFDAWYGAGENGKPDRSKPYAEQEKPPRSVSGVLSGVAGLIAEDRGMTPPATWVVPELAAWIDRQLDYATRQEWIGDVFEDFRGLLAQLKPVTGDPGRKHIGECPNVLDEGDSTRECGTRLYAPLRGDTIQCSNRECGREWPRAEWLRLGDLLDAS